MSLIPDQSYSFPDHFLRDASRARAARDKAVAPEPVELEPARPHVPVRTPVPVAPRTAALPKARANLRPAAPSARPAPPVKPVHAPRASVARAKIDIAQPRTAARTYSDDDVQMEMFSERETRSSKPRRSKFVRLMVAEAAALAVLAPSATLVLTRYLTDPTLILITNIVAITAAITAAMIPIILFAIAPTIPRGQ